MQALWDAVSGLLMGALGALPMWSVKVLVIGIFVALAVWALSLSKDYSYQGSEDRPAWKDVRIWAVVVIGLEIIPYLFF